LAVDTRPGSLTECIDLCLRLSLSENARYAAVFRTVEVDRPLSTLT
jgi:hypothetical protein